MGKHRSHRHDSSSSSSSSSSGSSSSGGKKKGKEEPGLLGIAGDIAAKVGLGLFKREEKPRRKKSHGKRVQKEVVVVAPPQPVITPCPACCQAGVVCTHHVAVPVGATYAAGLPAGVQYQTTPTGQVYYPATPTVVGYQTTQVEQTSHVHGSTTTGYQVAPPGQVYYPASPPGYTYTQGQK